MCQSLARPAAVLPRAWPCIIACMRLLLLTFLLLPQLVSAESLSLHCQGKTRFVHRGAPSTVPADEQRDYQIQDAVLDTLPCTAEGSRWSCFGLTAHQAMRRVQIDLTEKTVIDKLELPTSELIFEARCD